jgi:hypothetical protein
VISSCGTVLAYLPNRCCSATLRDRPNSCNDMCAFSSNMACLHAQDRQRFKVMHDYLVPEGGCEEAWRHAVDSILAITQTPTRRNKTRRYLSVAARYSIIAHADALGRALIDQLYVSICAK